jgi:Putative DNA-binding domain
MIEHVPTRAQREITCFAASFAAGLLNPTQATPSVVVGPRGKAAVKRYNVYRNNVTVSLINALAAVFPVVERITGTEFFRAMARFHIRESPPRSPLLLEYGRDFPPFIERYTQAQDMPWLADTARVERAWLDAYHAAQADPLAAIHLASVPTDHLSELSFVVHPTTRIVRSNYAALTIFAANRKASPVGKINAAKPEDALITRPKLEVEVRHLPEGGATFLTALIGGDTLGHAAAAALEAAPKFNIGANISGMLDAGVFCATRLGGEPCPS